MGGTRPAIRRARREDADAIARVHHDGWQVGYRGIVSDEVLATLPLEHYLVQWSELLGGPPKPRSGTFVAELDCEFVGVAAYAPTEHEGRHPERVAELTILYVHSAHQRGGVGRALLDAVANAMHRDGFEHAELWVFAENQGGRRFYEAMGWEEEGSVGEWRGAAASRYRTAL